MRNDRCTVTLLAREWREIAESWRITLRVRGRTTDKGLPPEMFAAMEKFTTKLNIEADGKADTEKLAIEGARDNFSLLLSYMERCRGLYGIAGKIASQCGA